MYKILVAQNDPDFCSVVSEALRAGLNCEVVAAGDSLEALRLAREEHPDVIILDVRMAPADGLEVCRVLKSGVDTKEISIVFLAAAGEDVSTKVRGMELGADDFIVQPVENTELVNSVKVALRRRLLFDQVRKSARERPSADRNKLGFLSGISHELRSPLNTMLGFCELLANEYYGPVSSKQREFLGIMEKSGRKLLDLVDGISLLVKLAIKKRPVKPESFVLSDVIGATWLELQSAAYRKNVVFQCRVPAEVDRLFGDKKGIAIILKNLLDNAVRFNRVGGRIDLTCHPCRCQTGKDRCVAVTVSDTGQGIEEEDRDSIFEPFPRMKKERRDGGCGLGLAVCKELLESMGGSIGFESETGVGSTFTVHMPVGGEGEDSDIVR